MAQFYKILDELETVRIGKMRFVLTPPAAWLAAKVAEQKSVTLSPAPTVQPQAVEVEDVLRRVGDNCGLCQRALHQGELTLSGRVGEQLHIVGECCAGCLDQLLGFGIYFSRPAPAQELALELTRELARQLAPGGWWAGQRDADRRPGSRAEFVTERVAASRNCPPIIED